MTRTATRERPQPRLGSTDGGHSGTVLEPGRDAAGTITAAPPATTVARSAMLAVAGLVAAVSLRGTPLLVLAGAAMACVVVADLSGFSKGEVERVWLPFVPWVAVAAAALPKPKPWLIASGCTAVALTVVLEARW